MRILMPIDGSPFTKKTVAYLAAHDEMFGKADEYTLIYVQSPIPPRAARAVGRELVHRFHADETEAATRAILKFFSSKGWKYRLVTRTGNAGEEIAALAASERFDLIVMGSHGHGALMSLLMGSTAQRVLATCKTPVLLIR